MIVIKNNKSILQAPPEKYKSLNEFFNDIYAYGEIVFAYCGQKYIVTYYDNELSLEESMKPDMKQTFTSPEEFAQKFCINGERFQDFVVKIDILIR